MIVWLGLLVVRLFALVMRGAWTNPSDPVSNTVITVAYAVANFLTQIRWLRILTGGADPPGSNYIVTSDSVSATTWKTGVTAIANVQGFQSVNRTGDTMSGVLTATGFQAGASGVNGGAGGVNGGAGGYSGGSTGVGAPAFLGVSLGTTGISANAGPITGTNATLTGTVSATGAIASSAGVSGTTGVFSSTVQAAAYAGGSTTVGEPDFLGVTVGANGIGSTGAINSSAGVSGTTATFTSYHGGSTAAGEPDFLGVTVGANGIGSTGAIASSAGLSGTTGVFSSLVQATRAVSTIATGTQPWTTTSTTKNTNLNADMVDDAHASATPTANTIPIADASGLLDAWVSASAGVMPSGMGALWSGVVASIPVGWSRWTAMNGRIPVSAGTTFSTTFVEGTSYGSSWSHDHTTPSHSHSGAGLSVSGTTGNNNNSGQSAGTGTNRADDPHTHTFSASVAGNTATDGSGTSGSTAWVIPMFAVVAVTKN